MKKKSPVWEGHGDRKGVGGTIASLLSAAATNAQAGSVAQYVTEKWIVHTLRLTRGLTFVLICI